ncbi:hypothetical protein KM043_010708 [Ampulex compressa]|nr:hypothetical protein KM043_010708 [Ampulex compressa]
MRGLSLITALLSPLLVLASLQSGTVTRGGSGIKIGAGERGTASRGIGQGRSNSGLRIGEGRLTNSTRQRSFPTTTTTTTPSSPRFTYAPQSSVGNNVNVTDLKVSGAPVPGDWEGCILWD